MLFASLMCHQLTLMQRSRGTYAQSYLCSPVRGIAQHPIQATSIPGYARSAIVIVTDSFLLATSLSSFTTMSLSNGTPDRGYTLTSPVSALILCMYTRPFEAYVLSCKASPACSTHGRSTSEISSPCSRGGYACTTDGVRHRVETPVPRGWRVLPSN